MATRMDNPLLTAWSNALALAGITGVEVVEDSTDRGREYSSGEASFRWGDLVLRLLRDRGQDFVDVAPAAAPSRYYSVDDLAVAHGWRSIESILARQEPIALAEELREISRHRTELESAFSPPNIVSTDAAITAARARRERAFLDKLKKLADGR